MSIAEMFAESVTKLRYRDIPPDVVAFSKRCLLDVIGNMISGIGSKKQKAALNTDIFESGRRESHILGGCLATKERAAFVNAIAVRSHDLDDGHRYAMGHPGSVIIPALLALSEARHVSGQDFVLALIIGYEVYARIGAVMYPDAYSKLGFESTGVCGAVAAAAAAAKVSGLPCEAVKNALGISATFSSGLIEYQNDGSDGKYLCPAIAAVHGLNAFDLAKSGFSGPDMVFEGQYGLFHSHGAEYTGGCLDDMWKDYKILDTYFKKHACMRGLHPSIDASLELRGKQSLRSSQIAKITIKTSPFVKRLDKNSFPKTLQQAQSTLAFVTSVAFKYGEVSLDALESALADTDIKDLIALTKTVVDDDVCGYVKEHPSHWGASKIQVVDTNGEVFEEWAPIALGERERPLSDKDLALKFRLLCKNTRYEGMSEELTDMIFNIDKFHYITDFLKKLS